MTDNIDTVIFLATTAENVVELMRQFAESTNPRLSNLATIFLEVRELHGRLKTPAWVVSQLNHQILNFTPPIQDYCNLTVESGLTKKK